MPIGQKNWRGLLRISLVSMLDIAGGWEHHLTTEEIAAAIAVADVRWLRIGELTSWYIEHQQPFPDDYVLGILAFCRANNLKLYWCEWKIDYQTSVATFNKILELIAGYQDIVTVGFKTNSGDLEPAAGDAYVADKFPHFGATVESWYWETRHRTSVWEPTEGLEDPQNMPLSWMIRHAQEARDAGAELIQFEPYWYFFENQTGKPRDSLTVMHRFLNSQMASVDNSTLVLETLMAEWQNNPAKTDVAWLAGRASTVSGYDFQPSKFDFLNSPKKYAVSCYSLGASSSSGKLWLKTELVAVEVIVKVLGVTLDKAALIRESMKTEVERIIYLYSKVGSLWDANPCPTGAARRRKIPGLKDVLVAQEGNPLDDFNFTRLTIQVRCQPVPGKSWVNGG